MTTERKITPWRAPSYKDAGVDIEAGDRAVEGLKSKIRKATRPEVVGGIGGFAGLFALDTQKYRQPLLASSTDGVGTKLVIAQRMGIHDTVGIDLVAMVVDDLVVCGAEPLFLLDYIACGKVIPERIVDIGAGITDGCRYAGCALIGGEIAEHPGVLEANEYDVSATGVGVVEADDQLGPDKVVAGDVVIGMASSGLHSNGFSLVRHVLLGEQGMSLDTVVPEFGRQRTLGEELLTPTKIYARDCLAIIAECEVHSFAHITGGGVPGNIVRILPPDLDAVIDRASWKPQPVFDLVARMGKVPAAEMERTFNMGMGMAAVVPGDQVDRTMALLTARGVDSWVAGKIEDGRGEVRLSGDYRSE
ncbi:MAG TPA: phosphoribosylformylglycinamidine cyclo-ligase [Stackebrandtia sp.]|jgi:phosphoribosylformylglycinamidine cyclo-ligase|uniref:phosphoribosylformylglycinamidine cyclo-ligase n=1 Tax=Stackebrandtia sp. TaxID=2023065 RepID=UPI002D2AB32D|nr:phosphoribosylformylglycinamidine cyclo-ligase [Stackebrandtia sp.]HZE37778.1 phosphoribosylformylglycinamidine cyclo-ligase [Stackebrandtia sp.]